MEMSRKQVLKLLHRQDWPARRWPPAARRRRESPGRHVSRSPLSHAGNHEANVRATKEAAPVTQALAAQRPQAGAAQAAPQARMSDPEHPTQPGPRK